MTAGVEPRIKIAQPEVEDDEQRAVADALASGRLAQGPRVAAFERAFAELCGVPQAVAVNSGTAALHLALLAHGIAGEGPLAPSWRVAGGTPEVIVPAFSFAASATAVLHAGARPVFCDVREDDFGIDPAALERAVTPRTRAVMAVHLYGQPCDIGAAAGLCALRGMVLIEDAAQAVGAEAAGQRAGSFGTGAFSFYATKNLQTGEGGIVTTGDATIAERVRVLRSQGERERYVTEEPGYNYRMTEPAAALGLAQVAKLAARTEARRANAARLTDMLHGVPGIETPREVAGRRHVYHQYTVRARAGRAARDRLQAALRERGIEAAVFYPLAIHRQPLYARLGYETSACPVAERLSGEVLSLPVHPALSADDVTYIGECVRALAAAL